MALPSSGTAPHDARHSDDLVGLVLKLSSARSPGDVMEVVKRGARQLTGADGITFVLRDGDQCHYADEEAISPLWKGQRFPLTKCISGWSMLNGQAAVIPDVYVDSRIPVDAYRLTFVRSLVMVPVRPEDPVAAIGAYWARRHVPTPAEIALLESIAKAASVALTNVALLESLARAGEDARRQAAELARAKEQVERVNEQKSRFLAACSHDLRQPFQAMRLFHGILADMATAPQQTALDKLGEALSQGEELLRALVDVSTIETGWVKPTPAPVNVNDLFERLEASYGSRAASKGLAFRVASCGETLLTDPSLALRLLGNLLDNALKFTSSGSIILRAKRCRDGVALQVWDSGIGIDRVSREQIFEDFYQAANSERDSRQGIGLGLGIVRRLAELLDGRVRVSSRLGRGSVFSVVLPA